MSGLLAQLQRDLGAIEISPPSLRGVLTRVTGMILTARGIRAPLGAYCEVMAEGAPPPKTVSFVMTSCQFAALPGLFHTPQ